MRAASPVRMQSLDGVRGRWGATGVLLAVFPVLFVIGWIARESYQMDFRAYYVAARSCLAGLDPYTNNASADPTLADSFVTGQKSRFLYPPLAAMAMVPFSLLPYPLARWVFNVVLAGLMLAVERMSLSAGVRQPPVELLSLLFVSLPVLTTFERGQIDLFCVALALAAFTLEERGRWGLGGAALALAASLKVFPALLALHFVMRRRVRFVAAFAVALVAFSSIPLLSMPSTVYAGFVRNTLPSLLEPGQPARWDPLPSLKARSVIIPPTGVGLIFNVDSPGLVFRPDPEHRFVHKVNPLAGFPLPFVAVAGVALYVLLDRRGVKSRGVQFGYFAGLTAINLANPLAWIMGLVWYIPVFLTLYPGTTRFGRLLLLLPLFLPDWVRAGSHSLHGILAVGLALAATFPGSTVGGLNETHDENLEAGERPHG